MPLSVEDRLAIQELIARYNHAIDGGDPDGWAATFAPDGTFESRGDQSDAPASSGTGFRQGPGAPVAPGGILLEAFEDDGSHVRRCLLGRQRLGFRIEGGP